MTKAKAARAIDLLTPRPVESEPVSKVVWRHRSILRPNDYNPNRVAPPELELLIISILEDGWTQPIVMLAPPDCGIVDGFHRWQVSEDPRMVARYAGMVPTVVVQADPVHRKMSTIRHNRARGTHAILPMAGIVLGMVAEGVERADLERRLGMESEEVDRLVDRAGSPERVGAAGTFGTAWVPGKKQEPA